MLNYIIIWFVLQVTLFFCQNMLTGKKNERKYLLKVVLLLVYENLVLHYY